jgi:hypothetical protein
MANKNPKFSKDVIERVLKRKIKEGKEEQKEFYESQKRQEKELEKFRKNRKPIVLDSESDEEEIPKTRMKTKKIVKRKIPEVHKDIDKYIKNFDLSIDKSLKPKNISKEKPKGRLMTTTKIVEPKPKGNELNKVIKLLEKMNQTKEIINAIKYVKNFIKNN